jgi:triosephosphate isomerase
MRTPIIAGNWKMHKNAADAVSFVQELTPHIDGITGVEKVVCPAFIALAGVSAALTGTQIKVGAQNVHWEEAGAYTSQIAPGMLVGLVEYVIIGHSEVRQYLAETDENVNRKAKALLRHGLKPIIAVGESSEQNTAGLTEQVVSGQVRAALDGIPAESLPSIVIAYEPIWAIGTGRNASPEIAQHTIAGIRTVIADLYGGDTAQQVRIQYGGSVKPNNMTDYMSQPDIDGALVGGASLTVSDFTQLIQKAAEAKGV